MKLTQRLSRLFFFIMVVLMLTAMPAINVMASKNGQTLPSAPPDTDTPTATQPRRPPPAATNTTAPTLPVLVNTPFDTPTATGSSTPSQPPATASATITQAPTVAPNSQSEITSTSASPVIVPATFVPTQNLAPTPTQPAPSSAQSTFDNSSFMLGVGALAVVLVVYFIARGRGKPGVPPK